MSQASFLRILLTLPAESPPTVDVKKPKAVKSTSDEEPFTRIGWGACGVICSRNDIVIKLANGGFGPGLTNDYRMHKEIKKQFKERKIKDVKVPQCYKFVEEEHFRDFAKKHPGLIPTVSKTCNIPTCAIVSSRIPSLPDPTRAALIGRYCPESIKDGAKKSPGNKDCLVRVYLGSMCGRPNGWTETTERPIPFSLRNFPLHLNQMRDLELDVEIIATRMATALAVMHWAALTDARDVEFVLGGTTRRGCVDFYILDFDQVRRISLNERGVKRAVEAAKLNDPYFPRPGRETEIEQLAWLAFANTYLSQSRKILEKDKRRSEAMVLPAMFLRGLCSQRDSLQASL